MIIYLNGKPTDVEPGISTVFDLMCGLNLPKGTRIFRNHREITFSRTERIALRDGDAIDYVSLV